MLNVYSPPQVDRIWLRVYYKKIPIYLIFYLLKVDYRVKGLGLQFLQTFWVSPKR